jgi:outer membrane protein OmpA-like peptidoglycan-associated protein
MSDKNKATRNKEEDPMLGVTADYRQVRRWKTALIGLVFFLSMSVAVQGGWQQPGEIEQPHGKWQVPGQIQQPKGPWQTPGAIQVPKGIQAIKQESSHCQRRIAVRADALFDFNHSNLRTDATQTLEALGPVIRNYGTHPVEIDGHTDAIGSFSYNRQLSEARAKTVKDWLVTREYISASTPITGYGKIRPISPNTNPDGSDNPIGRQKNRRVEMLIDTCK